MTLSASSERFFRVRVAFTSRLTSRGILMALSPFGEDSDNRSQNVRFADTIQIRRRSPFWGSFPIHIAVCFSTSRNQSAAMRLQTLSFESGQCVWTLSGHHKKSVEESSSHASWYSSVRQSVHECSQSVNWMASNMACDTKASLSASPMIEGV